MHQRGYIILLALVFVGIFLAISSGLINYLTSFARFERFAIANAQALAIAEGALDKVASQLNQDINFAGETNVTLGSGVYATKISTIDAETRQVVITASVPNSSSPTAQKKLTAQMKSTATGAHFDFGLQAGSKGVRMDHNTTIVGDLYSEGIVRGSGNSSVITGDATISGGSAQPEQEWLDQNSDFTFAKVASINDVAQSFIPDVSDNLSMVVVYLKKTSTPGDIHVRILTDANGKPCNTGASCNIGADKKIQGGPSGSVGSTYDFVAVTYPSSGGGTVPLTAGTRYWIVLEGPGVSTTKYYDWGIDTTDDYADNTGMYTSKWDASGAVWTPAGGDFVFQVYMGASTEPLTKVAVQGSASSTQMSNCSIGKDAFYVSIKNCTVTGTAHSGSTPPTPSPLPISDTQISAWESSAALGGTIAGPYTINGTMALGPKKINGNLIVNGNLKLTGPVWVNGTATFNSNSSLTVDPSTAQYGALLIADNLTNHATSSSVIVNSNVTMAGNGIPGSYLLNIAMNSDLKRHAIELKNNASTTSIFYAPHGYIDVHNNVQASNVVASKIHLHNNTTVTYQMGSPDKSFAGANTVVTWAIVPGTYSVK